MTVKNRGRVPRSHGEGFLEHKDSALVNNDDLQSRTNALEYDNDGNGTDDDSMKGNCDEHTLKPSFWRSSPTKYGEQKNKGVMRYDTKESSTSTLCPGKNRFETRHFRSCASMSAHPDQDGTLQMEILIKGEDGAKQPTSKTAHQLDLEAAITLVEMANGVPALPDDDFSFSSSKDMEDCDDDEDVLRETYGLLDGHGLNTALANKGQQHVEACASSGHDGLGTLLLECNWVTKRKRKSGVKYMDRCLRSRELIDEPSLKIQEGWHKVDAKKDSLTAQSCYLPFSERRTMDDIAMDDMVSDIKPSKKQHFTLATWTVVPGVSFSIIHLFADIRAVLVTPCVKDDAFEFCSELHSAGNQGSKQAKEKNLPSLTIHEIVQHIRANPRDPCILETREPLQDIVRGVLKIFSSKTAPVRAKGWKPLTSYERSSKSWSWIGPVSCNSWSDQDIRKEEMTSEGWGLPHKMLGKLVDCFSNWLRNSQETLQQIGSLPAPPMTSMKQIVDTRKSFRDIKTQKSTPTIRPSSEEVRNYFRREEALRYLVPYKAFPYTAADGRKSMVAPLRRASGKPSSKGRDHFMLKPDRPAHVTLLCLVRDAAARLPGNIGTREDICTLLRDSQYIAEGISSRQINQVVRGGLDRLHYEDDPCVQFDRVRKLWVYLHGGKEEEDFEDDATSPRPRKRQQKMAGSMLLKEQ